MNKKTVVFDLDDTLAHFTPDFRRFMFKEVLKRDFVDLGERQTYKLLDGLHGFEGTPEEALALYEDSYKMHHMPPTELAKHLYKPCCLNDDFDTVILTARGWMKRPTESVEEFLFQHNLPPPDNIVIVPLDQPKAQWIAESGLNIVAVLDDSPSQIKSLLAHNPKNSNIFIVDQPWNRDIKDEIAYRINPNNPTQIWSNT